MQLLWSLLIVDPLIAISTIICGTISLVMVELDASGRKAFSIARFWARAGYARISTFSRWCHASRRCHPGRGCAQ